MDVLVPMDDSEPSFRALRFATEFADCWEATLHVVHFTDRQTEATDAVVERIREILAETDHGTDPEVVADGTVSTVKPATKVGVAILDHVDRKGYDHLVMGHHGGSAVERMVLGSAAETVIREAEVPTTVVP